jgi:hypothetical protein
VSYKSRQKKRAIHASKHRHREKIAGRWYVTVVKRKTCCAKCAKILNLGDEMVYRHTPREARCKPCAELDPNIKPRPSQSWERTRHGYRW